MHICIHSRDDQNGLFCLVPLGARQVGSQDHDSSPWPGPLGGWDVANEDCEVSDITFCKGVYAHTHTYIVYVYIECIIYTYILEYIHLSSYTLFSFKPSFMEVYSPRGDALAVAKAGFKETVTWDGFLYVTWQTHVFPWRPSVNEQFAIDNLAHICSWLKNGDFPAMWVYQRLYRSPRRGSFIPSV